MEGEIELVIRQQHNEFGITSPSLFLSSTPSSTYPYRNDFLFVTETGQQFSARQLFEHLFMQNEKLHQIITQMEQRLAYIECLPGGPVCQEGLEYLQTQQNK